MFHGSLHTFLHTEGSVLYPVEHLQQIQIHFDYILLSVRVHLDTCIQTLLMDMCAALFVVVN